MICLREWFHIIQSLYNNSATSQKGPEGYLINMFIFFIFGMYIIVKFICEILRKIAV